MSVVELKNAYACKLGAPVLRAVDSRIFSYRYFRHCMECSFCHDSCCQHGVDIDLDNAARLKSVHGLKALVGVPDTDWFTDEIISDPEFPSGRHVRTRLHKGSCVFHAPNGRGCLIHRFCLEEGLDYHTLKPLVSVLFPLTFDHGLLTASTEILDGTLICSGAGPTCYEGAREELRAYFGDGLILELDVFQNGQ